MEPRMWGWWPPEVSPSDEADLLVLQDGTRWLDHAGVGEWLDRRAATGQFPRARVVGLDPPAGYDGRVGDYSANPGYIKYLAEEILPFLMRVPTRNAFLHGDSLAAAAALMLAVMYPGRVRGLFLQSGTFIQPGEVIGEEVDSEIRRCLGRIRKFVWELTHAPDGSLGPIPVYMTCGRHERGFPRNQAMAATLQRLGCRVRFTPVDGGHDWAPWVQSWDEGGLVELMESA